MKRRVLEVIFADEQFTGFGKFSSFFLTSPRWPSDDLLVCGDVDDDAYVELECFREFPEISLSSVRTMWSSRRYTWTTFSCCRSTG